MPLGLTNTGKRSDHKGESMLGTIIVLGIIAAIIVLAVVSYVYDSEAAVVGIAILCVAMLVAVSTWMCHNIDSASMPAERAELVDRIDSARRVGITTDAALIYTFGTEVREFNSRLAGAQQWNKTFDWWYADVVNTLEPVSLWTATAVPVDSTGITYTRIGVFSTNTGD